jgi:uncharacterized protein (TIGR02646 family)
MINITRPEEVPATLSSPQVHETKTAIAQKVASGEKLTERDFVNHWRASDVIEAISKMQQGKCCYCEQFIERGKAAEVEHFRPKGKVKEAPGHRGYWWLAYEWGNLLTACSNCNGAFKNSHFPLAEEAHRATAPDDQSLTAEKPLILDPTEKERITCIGWDLYQINDRGPWLAYARARDEQSPRANATITLCGLNRHELPRNRGTIRDSIKMILHSYLVIRDNMDAILSRSAATSPDLMDEVRAKCLSIKEALRSELERSRPFLSLRRELVRQDRPSADKFLGDLCAGDP